MDVIPKSNVVPDLHEYSVNGRQARQLTYKRSNSSYDDEGGGGEDDALEIVLVRSAVKGEEDAQHLLANQDWWKGKLGHRSPQVCNRMAIQ